MPEDEFDSMDDDTRDEEVKENEVKKEEEFLNTERKEDEMSLKMHMSHPVFDSSLCMRYMDNKYITDDQTKVTCEVCLARIKQKEEKKRIDGAPKDSP